MRGAAYHKWFSAITKRGSENGRVYGAQEKKQSRPKIENVKHHTVTLNNTEFLLLDRRWFKKGVTWAIYVRNLQTCPRRRREKIEGSRMRFTANGEKLQLICNKQEEKLPYS